MSDANLHADDVLTVRLDLTETRCGVGQAGIEQLTEAQVGVANGQQPDVRDVDEQLHRHGRAVDHVSDEALDVPRPRRSGVDPGGDARPRRQGVRVHAKGSRAPVDVRVEVDQARHDERALGRDGARGFSSGQGVSYHRDAAGGDTDIGSPPRVRVLVEQPATDYRQIELLRYRRRLSHRHSGWSIR